jgi:hypothetical protein
MHLAVVRTLLLVLVLCGVAGCTGASSVPGNYYENDIHRGYPGPGVTDPGS